MDAKKQTRVILSLNLNPNLTTGEGNKRAS
jgi:hypothetical protein